jgi:phage protein D
MKIGFRVLSNGNDVTAPIGDRLIGITVTDASGETADTAEIEIDDRDYLVALPAVGAVLQIAMGLGEELVELGQFVVDEIGGTVGPDTMSIKAKSADMRAAIKSAKTRAWQDVTLEDIVAKIAGEHGLAKQISDSLKSIHYIYLAQTSESDLNFLTRIARDLDATCKPAGGALVFVKTGEGKAADGTALPVFTVHRSQMASASWQLTGRGKFGRVVAEWSKRGTGRVEKVTAGNEEPEHILRTRYANQVEAQRAADAALAKSKRNSGTLSVELGGYWGDLMAEGLIDVSGIKPELNGRWLVKTVTHRLNATLTTSFDAVRDNDAASS